jgi:hypothetical protein
MIGLKFFDVTFFINDKYVSLVLKIIVHTNMCHRMSHMFGDKIE